MNHHYFQHNILEAGAHYADFPWRTANNINNTPFAEPPPYAGDKRIFLAEQFYNIASDNTYKALHKQYIEQCLNAFVSNTNVLQLISEEFTGPLPFVEFWIDVIADWEQAHERNVFTCLSVTKDVQDAILNDRKRTASIDVIDIRYWQIRDDGSLYDPEGGKNLAPRQFARLEKTGKPSFNSVYKAVSEYRMKYPNKAVIYSNWLDRNQHWAVFMASGSLAAIPIIQATGFLENASTMSPVKQTDDHIYTLQNGHNEQILYLKGTNKVTIDLSSQKGKYQAVWIDPDSGKTIDTESLTSKKTNELTNPQEGDVVLWIHTNK